MNLALGTAAFGMPYGMASGYQQVDDSAVCGILDTALGGGISFIDTAFEYGSSQKLIGSCFGSEIVKHKELCIISKTPSGLRNRPDCDIKKVFKSTCEDLRADRLYGYLVHDVQDLLSGNVLPVIENMEYLKYQQRIIKTGFSAYTRDEIEQVLDIWVPDIIQLPVSIVDQRLLDDGFLSTLKKQGIEIHVRSIFLQGVLLEDPAQLTDFLQPVKRILIGIDDCGNRLKVLLDFIRTEVLADVVVVGCHSNHQLQEILDVWATPPVEVDFKGFAVKDKTLLDPRLWPKRQTG